MADSILNTPYYMTLRKPKVSQMRMCIDEFMSHVQKVCNEKRRRRFSDAYALSARYLKI